MLALLASFLICFLQPIEGTGAAIQQLATLNERDRGIELYKAGDVKGAIDVLRLAVKRDKDDLTSWHYLGLALEQKGDKGSAKKAYEKAPKLGGTLLNEQLDRTPQAVEVPRALQAIRSQLDQAAASVERYLALTPKLSKSKLEDWSFRRESLRGFADLAGDNDLALYTGKDVTTKARVLRKPEPTYTEEARGNQTTGTVILRCIFGANGRVFAFHIVAGLPHGLTAKAILAAREIKFIPATKDGRPVSMWMELQYNFNLY
jgi:TonB family protein